MGLLSRAGGRRWRLVGPAPGRSARFPWVTHPAGGEVGPAPAPLPRPPRQCPSSHSLCCCHMSIMRVMLHRPRTAPSHLVLPWGLLRCPDTQGMQSLSVESLRVLERLPKAGGDPWGRMLRLIALPSHTAVSWDPDSISCAWPAAPCACTRATSALPPISAGR